MSPKKLLWRSALTLSLISLCACESKQASSNSDKQNLVEIKPFNTTFVSLESSPSDLIIYSIEADQAGNSYLLTNLPSILLFDANGNATGQITLSDNDTYATLFNDNASNVYYAQSGSSSDDILSKINFEQKALEEPMKDFQIADSINGICETAELTFMCDASKTTGATLVTTIDADR